MKIGAVVQARTTSTRLPRKVLKQLPYGSGITALEQVLLRLGRSRLVEQIVVATTSEVADDSIVEIAHHAGVHCYRGSNEDVLERFYLAAVAHDFDVVVRITSDCPCIDPEIVDHVVGEHLRSGADFTTNCLIRTFVHGVDTEVLAFSALETAHREATQRYERQHVCPYIYKTAPGQFNIIVVRAPRSLAAADIRATLDTPEDYALLCAVFDALYEHKPNFGVRDVIDLVRDKPWLKSINGRIIHKQVVSTPDEEVREAVRVLDVQDLHRARDLLAAHWLQATKRAETDQRELVEAAL